jgi:hypothetical protein
MAVDYQAMLDRRAQVADEIVETVNKLGELAAEERDLQDQLRRAAERDGSRTNPVSVMDAICAELTRAGLSPHRVDARIRLGAEPAHEGNDRAAGA